MNVREPKGNVTYCVSEDAESEREAVAAFHTTQRTVKARYKAYDLSDYDTLYADVQAGRCDVLYASTTPTSRRSPTSARPRTWTSTRTPAAASSSRAPLEAAGYRGRAWAMPRHFPCSCCTRA